MQTATLSLSESSSTWHTPLHDTSRKSILRHGATMTHVLRKQSMLNNKKAHARTGRVLRRNLRGPFEAGMNQLTVVPTAQWSYCLFSCRR